MYRAVCLTHNSDFDRTYRYIKYVQGLKMWVIICAWSLPFWSTKLVAFKVLTDGWFDWLIDFMLIRSVVTRLENVISICKIGPTLTSLTSYFLWIMSIESADDNTNGVLLNDFDISAHIRLLPPMSNNSSVHELRHTIPLFFQVHAILIISMRQCYSFFSPIKASIWPSRNNCLHSRISFYKKWATRHYPSQFWSTHWPMTRLWSCYRGKYPFTFHIFS